MNRLLFGIIACLSLFTVAAGASPGPGRLDRSAEELRSMFADPPNEYRIVQYGNPTPKQIELYRNYGIGGFMAFFNNYLRDPSHPRHQDPAGIGPMIDAAKAGGFQLWLADDYGYPSGMAGGGWWRITRNSRSGACFALSPTARVLSGRSFNFPATPKASWPR